MRIAILFAAIILCHAINPEIIFPEKMKVAIQIFIWAFVLGDITDWILCLKKIGSK